MVLWLLVWVFWVFWVWACAAVCFGFGLVPGVSWCNIVWVGAGFGVAGLADLWFGGVAAMLGWLVWFFGFGSAFTSGVGCFWVFWVGW